MAEEYVETERSKWARDRLKSLVMERIIAPESPEGGVISRIGYDALTAKTLLRDEKSGFEKLIGNLRDVDSPEYTLTKFCVKGNLDDERLYGIIKKFIWDVWRNEKYFFGDKKDKESFEIWVSNGRESARRVHGRFCELFEIKPDPDFPDW